MKHLRVFDSLAFTLSLDLFPERKGLDHLSCMDGMSMGETECSGRSVRRGSDSSRDGVPLESEDAETLLSTVEDIRESGTAQTNNYDVIDTIVVVQSFFTLHTY